jgi:hypothetical protein
LQKIADDNSLEKVIPELLKVINDLKPLRKSKQQTDNYIDAWRKTKYKEYLYLPDENGKTVECFNNIPDMTIHDRYINWLFDYFYELYKRTKEKTISYAYALDVLTVYHNQQILNRRIFEKMVDRPNTNIDDIKTCIEKEKMRTDALYEQEQVDS